MKKIVAWLVLALIFISIIGAYLSIMVFRGVSFMDSMLIILGCVACAVAVGAAVIWCVNVLVD
jgi:hypothetical protein